MHCPQVGATVTASGPLEITGLIWPAPKGLQAPHTRAEARRTLRANVMGDVRQHSPPHPRPFPQPCDSPAPLLARLIRVVK